MIRITVLFVLIFGVSLSAFSQRTSKQPVQAGTLYFSLTADLNGKKVVVGKDNGKIVRKDSLRMASAITAYYKVGQKTTAVKDIAYDNYFLSDSIEPTILQDMHGLAFDTSIWISCIDSLHKKEQVVFQIREITLEDGSKIQNPKLANESKAVYYVHTNPNFPAGGWESKANHWISMWKEWFRIKDSGFYKLDDKTLELYARGIVFTIK